MFTKFVKLNADKNKQNHPDLLLPYLKSSIDTNKAKPVSIKNKNIINILNDSFDYNLIVRIFTKRKIVVVQFNQSFSVQRFTTDKHNQL
jgi:hypothetical protein